MIPVYLLVFMLYGNFLYEILLNKSLLSDILIREMYSRTKKTLVHWHIHFQTNDAEYFFIDKATERGDAVASSIEVNAVQWENRQVN